MFRLVDGALIALSADEIAERQAAEIAEKEKMTRLAKVEEIKAHALSLITALLPEVDTIEEVEFLKKIAPAFNLSATGTQAASIYVYARNRVQDAMTLPIDQVEAYDPETDPNW